MSIFVVGDTALAEGLNLKSYYEITKLIGSKPLILNLEGPILPKDHEKIDVYEEYKFNLFSNEAAFIKFSKDFNLLGVSLANNHFCDYKDGNEFTLKTLNSNNISFAGLKEKPFFNFEYSGQKYIYYSFVSELTDLSRDAKNKLNIFDYKRICDDIKKLKISNVDTLIIVSPHWGYESQEIPQQADKALANELMVHGADFIIGHHPHVIQSFESDKKTVFSVGNFILSDGPYRGRTLSYKSLATKRLLIVEISSKGIIRHLFLEQNEKYSYEGAVSSVASLENTSAPKGYPEFTCWLSFRSGLFLKLFTIKKYIRKLLIFFRIHKPYNW